MTVVVVSLLLVAVMPVHAKRVVVELGAQHLTDYTPAEEGLGKYYTLALPIPEVVEGKEILGAYLELYLDVDAREIDEVVSDTPHLDVFTLTQSLGESMSAEALGEAIPEPGYVMRGENRRVLRDITGIVRSVLATPTSNHGLILGSLTGVRDGLFTVKSSVLDQGVVARLIIHYRDVGLRDGIARPMANGACASGPRSLFLSTRCARSGASSMCPRRG
jgi:hypothetical protein